jgi:hypothetical protein
VLRKVVFLVQTPFNERDYKRFGIEILVKNGFNTWVWDFTPFLYPHIYGSERPLTCYKFENLIQFRIKTDAIDAIGKENKDTFIISLISYGTATFSIFKAISKNSIPFSVFLSNAIPSSFSSKTKKSFVWKIKRFSLHKLANYLLSRIQSTHFGIRPATLALAGGAKLPTKIPLVNEKTEMVWIHTLDYDIYLNDKNSEEQHDSIAVFIDEDYVFHSDYEHIGIASPTNAEEYFPILRNFFEYVETNLGLEVVIAAHPRSTYEKRPDFFGGRKVIKGRTSDLVKNATLVILQDSTSINFAVLYEKPMVFVTTDSIEETIYGEHISRFAACFRKTPINLDGDMEVELEKELFVDDELYSKFKRDFIKVVGTPDLPFWQIVSNRIKSLDD